MGKLCISKFVCFCVGVLDRFCVTSGRRFWHRFWPLLQITQLLAPVLAPLSAQSGFEWHHFWHHFWHRFWRTQGGKSHKSVEMRYIKSTVVPKVVPKAQLNVPKVVPKQICDVPKLVPKLQWVVPKQVPRHHFWHYFWHQNRCHNVGEPNFASVIWGIFESVIWGIFASLIGLSFASPNLVTRVSVFASAGPRQ